MTRKTPPELSRPPGSETTETGLHGPPPDGYPENCFYHMDNSFINGEIWFYTRIAPFIDRIYDVGADTTIYRDFAGEVHYFEPISTSNIFEAEAELKKGTDTLRNGKSYFNNYGLSNVTADKQLISWEAGDMRPNPEGDDFVLGDDIYMKTRRAEEYVVENNHDTIGFVSIDVEGHELEVLQGFGEQLKNVAFVQIEHGGTTYSAGHKLSEIIQYLSEQGFWGFSYLNMHTGNRHSQSPQDLMGGLTPLNWDENSEDHYAYCNIVCVNKKFLSTGSIIQRPAAAPNSYTTLIWPESKQTPHYLYKGEI